jgi:hypothetical protein
MISCRSSPDPSTTPNKHFMLRKCHICISKALWVLQKASSNPRFWLRETGKHAGDFHHFILNEMCKTITSMAKDGILPDDDREAVFSPDINSCVSIEYPSLGLDLGFLLTGHISSTTDDQFDAGLLGRMPLGHCNKTFYYTTLFIDVYIFSQSSNSQQIRYPAICSLVRTRKDPQVSMILASQDGKLNVCIKREKDLSCAWGNVTWLDSIDSLEVRLPTGFQLQI